MADEDIDVAIVGAGVSGVYSAWRLQQAHPGSKVVVFEASRRVGGRLLSVSPPDIPNMVAELGGMRILPAVQPLITRLIEVLNAELPASGTIELYDFPVDQPQNIAFLRGVHLRLADFVADPDLVPYTLSFLERGGTAGSIIVDAIEQIVPGITAAGLTEEQRRQMARDATFSDMPLYQQGFWNVLLRVISSEAFQLGVDAGGYTSTLTNWNASDAIPWYLSDFGIDPKYKGFKLGYDQVPKALANLFVEAGGEIRMGTPLVGFGWAGDGVELRTASGTVGAKTLVLAMPRRALDLLTPTSPPLQEIADVIASVTPQPMFKLFTTYANPWWRSAGLTLGGTFVPVESGRTVTDLPVRQTYYWPLDDGQPARTGPAMLMASYDDGSDVGFWDGLRPRRRQARALGVEVAAPARPFVGDDCDDSDQEWCQYQADRRMVAEVARQLAAIHGLSYTPAVRNAAFRDWGDDPYGGGWNSWNIGVKSWEVKERMTQPFDGRPLHVCGEAYSDAQGWVEGALQTAERMLAKLGIDALI